ncbi:MAG: glycosyltransferase family 39 protein, partial [Paracoccaceae bacterium]
MTPQPAQPIPSPLSAPAAGLLALALAFAIAVILPLLRPILPVDETRYLSVAWEMQRDGTFIVPHLNGEIYAHKPPLLFWLINLIWSVTGVSEVAARLVAPAFGILSVALTWRLGNRLFPDYPGLGATAALILASTGIFALYGSLTMFDTMLASATLLGVLALLRMDAGGRWLATLGLGAALAFGVLAKGPVILVHLLPLALARPLWTMTDDPRRAAVWYGRLATAIGAALAILAVWLLPALLLGGQEYRAEVLWRQSAGRMVNAFDHARPIWFFVALLPILLWPWAWRPSALRGLGAAGLWRDRRAWFLAIWGLATLALFSLISGKQVHY